MKQTIKKNSYESYYKKNEKLFNEETYIRFFANLVIKKILAVKIRLICIREITIKEHSKLIV